MKKKMLLKLADFLRNTAKDSWFDLTTWKNNPDDNPHKCKTTACAFGWCPVVFPRAKLKSTWYGVTYKDSKRRNFVDYQAAAHFFQISEEQAKYLFSPDYYSRRYRGRISVAKRIEDFVNSGDLRREKSIQK